MRPYKRPYERPYVRPGAYFPAARATWYTP